MSTNAIYIPSKGRPQCVTARYLIDIGYPSEWFILLGDDDGTIEQYYENFEESHIIVFDKKSALEGTDMMDAYGDDRPSGVAPARNEVARQARMHGLTRCWMFDDDYDSIVLYTKKPFESHVIDDGEWLFSELDKIESFGESTELPVVGFDTRLKKETWPLVSKYVFNGFNIDVREGHFMPFRGRLFEDAVHTIQMANIGKSDICFNHLRCHAIADSFAWNGAKTKEVKGGLNELYHEYVNGWDERDTGRLANCQYSIIASPTYYHVYFKPDGFGWSCNMGIHVKTVSGKWARQ